MNFDANEAIFIPTNNILFRERSYYPENLQRQSVAIVYPLLPMVLNMPILNFFPIENSVL